MSWRRLSDIYRNGTKYKDDSVRSGSLSESLQDSLSDDLMQDFQENWHIAAGYNEPGECPWCRIGRENSETIRTGLEEKDSKRKPAKSIPIPTDFTTIDK